MRVIYHKQDRTIAPYPRKDEEEVINLESDYLVLLKIDTLPPEYDINTEVLENTYIVDLDKLEYRQEWVIIPLPPRPNWDNFNYLMLSDPDFNQVCNLANTSSVTLVASLPASLTQVSDGKITMFQSVWQKIITIGGATLEMQVKWSDFAISSNLPSDFVEIIKGDA